MFGNLGKMAELMSKAKEIKETIQKMKEELPREEFRASSPSGNVTAVVSGDLILKRLEFNTANADATALNGEICFAVNAALVTAKSNAQNRLKAAAGGIDLPDLPLA